MKSLRAPVTLAIVLALGVAVAAPPPAPLFGGGAADDAAGEYLVRAFPKTRQLVQHFAEHDPAALEPLLASARAHCASNRDEVLAFADENHPELATILRELCRADPDECELALLDVAGDARHFEDVKATRSPERYARELEAWQLDSRIRLLAARVALADSDPGVEAELRQLVEREVELQREGVQRQIDRHRKNIDKLEQRLADPAEGAVKKRMRQLLKVNRKKKDRD